MPIILPPSEELLLQWKLVLDCSYKHIEYLHACQKYRLIMILEAFQFFDT